MNETKRRQQLLVALMRQEKTESPDPEIRFAQGLGQEFGGARRPLSRVEARELVGYAVSIRSIRHQLVEVIRCLNAMRKETDILDQSHRLEQIDVFQRMDEEAFQLREHASYAMSILIGERSKKSGRMEKQEDGTKCLNVSEPGRRVSGNVEKGRMMLDDDGVEALCQQKLVHVEKGIARILIVERIDILGRRRPPVANMHDFELGV
ncbi:hypothetical protein [Methylocystis sp. JR02]|uniref:hypothetical protein n=1 Tax=Methylocystis sp. JR02 TaxID=3046284 RepID=UPI0024BA1998|nr:hypothetical protein [Methylocystis sp. JR02]MDJ0447122.1 hypothetical protein [Methylocystis sp. JR02]